MVATDSHPATGSPKVKRRMNNTDAFAIENSPLNTGIRAARVGSSRTTAVRGEWYLDSTPAQKRFTRSRPPFLGKTSRVVRRSIRPRRLLSLSVVQRLYVC